MPFGRYKSSHRFPSSKTEQHNEHMNVTAIGIKQRMQNTTKFLPSAGLPVFLRKTSMRGHTPTMFLTTSTSDGIDSSPVTMARRRPERDIIQSRCSAPLSLVTMKSVMENVSKNPKMDDDTFCEHRFKSLRSKMGTQPASDRTHCPNSRRKRQSTRLTHQKQQHLKPNCSQQPQLSQSLIIRE